ncbi:MAG: GNAT family N-acetyltransferase [Fusicatenibacter sp.]
MKYHKEIMLKDARRCLMKSAALKDARISIDHRIQTAGETEYLACYPDEIRVTEAEESFRLKEMEDSSRAVTIFAYIDGKMAASGRINPVNNLEKYRHRAEMAISIKKPYWNLGIGSALVGVLMEQAKEAGYEQIELDVASDNVRAISLYEKMGFCTYGIHKSAMRCRDGKAKDLILMACLLKEKSNDSEMEEKNTFFSKHEEKQKENRNSVSHPS